MSRVLKSLGAPLAVFESKKNPGRLASGVDEEGDRADLQHSKFQAPVGDRQDSAEIRGNTGHRMLFFHPLLLTTGGYRPSPVPNNGSGQGRCPRTVLCSTYKTGNTGQKSRPTGERPFLVGGFLPSTPVRTHNSLFDLRFSK